MSVHGGWSREVVELLRKNILNLVCQGIVRGCQGIVQGWQAVDFDHADFVSMT